jgi:hypothetical protein
VNPFQARQVVEHFRLNRRRGYVEGLQGLGDREPSGLESVDDVGGIAGSQFGLDQGPQDFFGGPTLRLSGDQDFWRGAPDRGELEPPQTGIEISC